MSGEDRVDWKTVATRSVAALFVVGGWSAIIAFAKSSAAPTDASQTPDAALAQTVMYQSYDGFQVCTRRVLRDCVLTFTKSDGLNRSVGRIGPFGIEPAVTCSSISQDATARCGDAGVDPLHTVPGTGRSGPTREWLACAARHGFLHRDGATVTAIDPRDENSALPLGDLRLQCREGFLSMHANNPLW